MNHLVRQELDLEQYQCSMCGRFFYLNKLDISSLDLDFRCPYCDSTGGFFDQPIEILTRIIHTKIWKVEERNEKARV